MSSWRMQFPGNLAWSNATLVTKGMAPYGAVALGEIDDVCQRLMSRQAEPDSWSEEWCRLGERLRLAGDRLEAQGHRKSAGNAYLRAGMYYFTGERFVYPGEQKREIGRLALKYQQAGLVRRHPSIEPVEVPFESTTLPGLFMKASESASGKVPTVVVFDGMDNCKEMSVLFCGLEFAARGWNTLAIDGPGQGESLRLRDLYARYDYEGAGTAAFDFLAARPEVNRERMAVLGYSFGGYYAARIAAFEKRYAAAVAFSALHWDLAAFQRDVQRRQAADPKATAQSSFHFSWIMGCLGNHEASIRKAERFSVAEIASRITRPFLIVHGKDDKLVPVAAAHRLYEALDSCPERELQVMTAEDGGSGHCLVDNRQAGVDRIADWLETKLGS